MSTTINHQSKSYSSSSIEAQRALRIEKMNQLKALGHDPFAVKSHRDFTLGFVAFWFNFIHDYNLDKFVQQYPDTDTQFYFLEQVLFPTSLLEKQEERILLKEIAKDMELDLEAGLEPEFSETELNQARKFFPNLWTLPETTKEQYLKTLFNIPNRQDDTTELEPSKIVLKPKQKITLAGRIKSKRVSGKIAFTTMEDESLPEGFQFVFKQDLLDGANTLIEQKINNSTSGSLTFSQFKNLIDEGDYIQASGYLDRSQTGEPSLFVESVKILTKCLRPLPDKLDYENFEERYLNRVVDFKMNTKDENGLSVREIVRLKQKYWHIWRDEMQKEGFLEVECPVFEKIPGGAEARPFTTFYNELDQEVYLRISLELPLKKLIAGGFERVFEIGRIFRNEGSSPQHLQEYTQIEFYWAYADYTDGMKLVKRIYQRIVQEILGQLKQIDYYGHEVNWGDWCSLATALSNGWGLANNEQVWEPDLTGQSKQNIPPEAHKIFGWPIIPYYDAVKFYSKGEVDFRNKSLEDLLQIAKEKGVDIEPGAGIASVMDKIYKKVARPHIHNPIFLALVPVELEPLAKRHPPQPNLTERWQIVAGTAELGKCFSELNDPVDQFERFQQQQAARDAGDEEAQFMDEDYVKALELGTPPMAGFGTSERFLSFLLGKHIKECVTFPHVRTQENKPGKSKSTMVAHVVLWNHPELTEWQKYNTIAHLTASFAAREGKKLILFEHSHTQDGENIPMNIQHAIMIKQTDDLNKLRQLKKLAEQEKLLVTVFTEEMQLTSDDYKVNQLHTQKLSSEIKYLGVLVYGKKSLVEKLTTEFTKI
jgi:lysyl-tRNA synthetase class 2